MREREGGRRERKKLYCNGWIHVNEFLKKLLLLLLFVSFCCMHLYFMFTDVSFQMDVLLLMFFHVTRLGFLK